ncbi:MULTISPECIES: class A sortase [Leuconostoc]|uniref:Sortase A, LPXTG specific n=1 Tax=Leuconostoc inhae TaxID=178001 RepID=A0AAN2QUZ2_9LACO|nr:MULTISPECIES: class A sortase [Leuconostoc]MBZ5947840.1 class A sortase [Leuconostoc gasicomitatum]MBZ5955672.1 class A sortase [Leuconostoc gasicomitatum]MBZ5960710.1 class A sortase [Leuconostoc gasicomitatum]MBZ5979784.1 class A sortase [Leuconostoc gasicomitatum]MBZ5983417.1 class A sortase [Leuconostoc gasicomitatum]
MTNQSNEPYTFYQEKKPRMTYKKRIITAGIVLAVIGGVTMGMICHAHHTAQAANYYQAQDVKVKHKIATGAQRQKVLATQYSGNTAISSSAQIKQYRQLPGQLYLVGYIAIPVQDGVKNPVTTMQINEGATNKVLAYGAGTVKSGQNMGEANFSLAAHNYGDNKTGFSPLQSSIDVDKHPKAYLSDGNKIYIYQFNSKNESVSGNTVVNYKNTSVASDKRVTNKPLLTLVTCDEPGWFNLHPENRKVLTAHLLSETSVSDASKTNQQLFTN